MTISLLPWHVKLGTLSDDKRLESPQAMLLDAQGGIVALVPSYDNAEFIIQQTIQNIFLQEKIEALENELEALKMN